MMKQYLMTLLLMASLFLRAQNVPVSQLPLLTADSVQGTDFYPIVHNGHYYRIYFNASGAPAWSLEGNSGTNSGANFLGTADEHDLRLVTNNVTALTIDSATQNIGIGITTPVDALQIQGSLFQNYQAGTGYAGITSANDSSLSGFNFYSNNYYLDTSGDLNYYNGVNNQLTTVWNGPIITDTTGTMISQAQLSPTDFVVNFTSGNFVDVSDGSVILTGDSLTSTGGIYSYANAGNEYIEMIDSASVPMLRCPEQNMYILPQLGKTGILNVGSVGDSTNVLVANGVITYYDQITYSTPNSGNTVFVGGDEYNIINPSGSLSALTISLSGGVTGQWAEIKFTQAVTTITWTGTGQHFANSVPTSAIVGTYLKLVYKASNSTWY
jgi:hypothetical protein